MSRVPEIEPAVTAGGECAPVPAEGNTAETVAAGERRKLRVAVCRVPQQHCPVLSGRGECAPVRAKGDVIDGVKDLELQPAIQRSHLRVAARCVPDHDLSVTAG